MLRVLMVLEDYGELMFLQTVLKKIGFDVDAIQNPHSFAESLLRMNPDVLVMTAAGRRVRGQELVKQVKKTRGLPHVVLLRANGQDEDTSIEEADRWLESPVGALDLLNCIGELCHLNQQVLQEKFQKLHLQEAQEEQARILKINDIVEPSLNRGNGEGGSFGNLKASELAPEERRKRYESFLADKKAVAKVGFSVKKVQDQIKDLRRDENTSDLEDLERERKAFVEHLFKKKA